MTDQGQSKNSLTSVEFEVLMEFQRHVKNRYDQSRILWFNTAVSSLASRQDTTSNEIMKKALTDFDKFIAQVEKEIGPVPSGEDTHKDKNALDGNNLDEFDQLLDDD